jgi:hypothetical protein
MESCPDLERLILCNRGGDLMLSRSDIISLRRLKHIEIDCAVRDEAESALSKCLSLKSLCVGDLDLSDVLPSIGENLFSLKLGNVNKEELGSIGRCCLNLQYLEIGGGDVDEESNAIKNLAKLKVNGESLHLRLIGRGINAQRLGIPSL